MDFLYVLHIERFSCPHNFTPIWCHPFRFIVDTWLKLPSPLLHTKLTFRVLFTIRNSCPRCMSITSQSLPSFHNNPEDIYRLIVYTWRRSPDLSLHTKPTLYSLLTSRPYHLRCMLITLPLSALLHTKTALSHRVYF